MFCTSSAVPLRFFASVALVLLLTSACVAQRLSDDAYVVPSHLNANHGSDQKLLIAGSTNSDDPRGAVTYLKFDPPVVPQGSKLVQGTITIYVDQVNAAGMIDVFTLLDNWNENTITAGNAPRRGPAVITGLPVNSAGYVTLDVTSAYVAGLAANGFAIAADPASPGISIRADSKEDTDTSHAAFLQELVSGPPGARGAPGPQGPAGLQGPPGPPPPNAATTTQSNTFFGNQFFQNGIFAGSFNDVGGSGSGIFFDPAKKLVSIVGGPGWDINLIPGTPHSANVIGSDLTVQGEVFANSFDDMAKGGARMFFTPNTFNLEGTVSLLPASSDVTQSSPSNSLVFNAHDNTSTGCGVSECFNYQWSLVAKPAGSAAAISGSTLQANVTATDGAGNAVTPIPHPSFVVPNMTVVGNPAFSPDVPGTYDLSLTVKDSTGRTTQQDAFITATSCGNCVPSLQGYSSVGGGSPQEIFAGSPSNFDVFGAFTAPTGTIGALTAGSVTTPKFSADTLQANTNLAVGTGSSSYALSTDGHNLSFNLVTAGTGSNPPVISNAASISKTGVYTGTGITIDATVSDADNTDACSVIPTLCFRWSLVSRPSGALAALRTPPSSAAAPAVFGAPSFVPDMGGDYQVQAIATDSVGHKSPATMSIHASSCGTAAPCTPGLEGTTTVGSNPPTRLFTFTPNVGLDAPSFVADGPNGKYQLSVTVSDALGNPTTGSVFFAPTQPSSCGSQPCAAGVRASSTVGSGLPQPIFSADPNNFSVAGLFNAATANISTLKTTSFSTSTFSADKLTANTSIVAPTLTLGAGNANPTFSVGSNGVLNASANGVNFGSATPCSQNVGCSNKFSVGSTGANGGWLASYGVSSGNDASGVATITANLTDAAGNIAGTSASFVIDKTGPTFASYDQSAPPSAPVAAPAVKVVALVPNSANNTVAPALLSLAMNTPLAFNATSPFDGYSANLSVTNPIGETASVANASASAFVVPGGYGVGKQATLSTDPPTAGDATVIDAPTGRARAPHLGDSPDFFGVAQDIDSAGNTATVVIAGAITISSKNVSPPPPGTPIYYHPGGGGDLTNNFSTSQTFDNGEQGTLIGPVSPEGSSAGPSGSAFQVFRTTGQSLSTNLPQFNGANGITVTSSPNTITFSAEPINLLLGNGLVGDSTAALGNTFHLNTSAILSLNGHTGNNVTLGASDIPGVVDQSSAQTIGGLKSFILPTSFTGIITPSITSVNNLNLASTGVGGTVSVNSPAGSGIIVGHGGGGGGNGNDEGISLFSAGSGGGGGGGGGAVRIVSNTNITLGGSVLLAAGNSGSSSGAGGSYEGGDSGGGGGGGGGGSAIFFGGGVPGQGINGGGGFSTLEGAGSCGPTTCVNGGSTTVAAGSGSATGGTLTLLSGNGATPGDIKIQSAGNTSVTSHGTVQIAAPTGLALNSPTTTASGNLVFPNTGTGISFSDGSELIHAPTFTNITATPPITVTTANGVANAAIVPCANGSTYVSNGTSQQCTPASIGLIGGPTSGLFTASSYRLGGVGTIAVDFSQVAGLKASLVNFTGTVGAANGLSGNSASGSLPGTTGSNSGLGGVGALGTCSGTSCNGMVAQNMCTSGNACGTSSAINATCQSGSGSGCTGVQSTCSDAGCSSIVGQNTCAAGDACGQSSVITAICQSGSGSGCTGTNYNFRGTTGAAYKVMLGGKQTAGLDAPGNYSGRSINTVCSDNQCSSANFACQAGPGGTCSGVTDNAFCSDASCNQIFGAQQMCSGGAGGCVAETTVMDCPFGQCGTNVGSHVVCHSSVSDCTGTHFEFQGTAGQAFKVMQNGTQTANLDAGGNFTGNVLAAKQVCLNQDCRIAWPQSVGSGTSPFFFAKLSGPGTIANGSPQTLTMQDTSNGNPQKLSVDFGATCFGSSPATVFVTITSGSSILMTRQSTSPLRNGSSAFAFSVQGVDVAILPAGTNTLTATIGTNSATGCVLNYGIMMAGGS
jgi:hypothetical protein